MGDNKPIKRSPQLLLLSREHHAGLQCAWKIRQGLKAGVDTDRIREYIRYFWENHLTAHFRSEEELLYNTSDNELCKQALLEHAEMRKLITRINEDVHKDVQLYGQFADNIEAHIRMEERQLFPLLESILPADKLAEIGTALAEGHEPLFKDEYLDEFWVNNK